MTLKKILLLTFILLSAFGGADFAFAAPTGAPPATTTTPDECDWDNWSACARDIKDAVVDGISEALSGAAGAAAQVGLDLIIKIFAYIAGLIFLISQFFLWLGAMVLDQALKFLVLEMGVFVSGDGPAQTIRLAWVAIRDLMNLAIVGGFIAIGISTILQIAQYNASKFLSRLIIAALLVNFSFFFAGAMIDAANFVTVKIYDSKMFQGNCVSRTTTNGKPTLTSSGCTISNAFMASTKLGTLEDLNKLSQGGSTEGSYNLKFLVLAIFGSVLFFVAGFVFFTAGILLIGRFVALILLLVTSPLGIAGTQIPYIDKYAGKWWSEFTSQVLFAPIYMILIAISFQIIKGTTEFLQQKSGGDVSLASIGSGNFNYTIESAMPLVLSFFIAVSFMWTALKIAQQMSKSEYFGDVYGFLNKSFGGFYGNRMNDVFAPIAGVYDVTLGKLLNASYIGKPLDRAIGSNLRNVGGGFGATGTYKQRSDAASKANDARLKERATIAKGIAYAANALGMSSGKALEEEQRRRNKELADLIKNNKNGENDAEIRRQLEGKSLEQIATIVGGDMSKVAHLLSDKQLEEFMKSDKVLQKDKEKVFDARFGALNRAIDSGNDQEVKKILSEMSETEAKLYYNQRRQFFQDKKNADKFERFANSLNAKQADAVHNDPGMSKDEKRTLSDTRLGVVRNPDGTVKSVNSDRVSANAGKLSERELNELPHEEFVKVIPKVKPSVVRKRIENAKTPKEEQDLRAAAKAAGLAVEANPGAIAN